MMALRAPLVSLVLVSSTALPLSAQPIPRPIVMSAGCSPQVARSSGDLPTIIGGQDAEPRTLFGTRETVVVDAGSSKGIQAGRRFYVRRTIVNRYENKSGQHAAVTAGWLTITAANENTAFGRIDFACDGIQTGDYLQPFVPPALPPDVDRTNAAGAPDFSRPGRVMFGDRGRLTGGAGDFMLADFGQAGGAVPGARYAVYRNLGVDGLPLTAVGEVVLISVGENDSLFRLTQTRDAVIAGDLLIPRRQ
jgi:hypothetical protein